MRRLSLAAVARLMHRWVHTSPKYAHGSLTNSLTAWKTCVTSLPPNKRTIRSPTQNPPKHPDQPPGDALRREPLRGFRAAALRQAKLRHLVTCIGRSRGQATGRKPSPFGVLWPEAPFWCPFRYAQSSISEKSRSSLQATKDVVL